MAEADYAKLHWIAENLKIINKEGELVYLRPNNGQLLLHKSIQAQRSRNLPVRIALLKPRQVGWTTWCEAEAFHDVYHKPNWNAMAVSLDAESTEEVFGMAKLFHSEMPNPKETDNTNRKEIIFSKPHRSRFLSQTAGKVGVGRSFRAQVLHCSEVAWWQNAKTQLAGLYQIVPKNPNTTIILETTAKGIGGAFHDTFWNAVDRRKKSPDDYRGFLPVFFPWYKFPEYQIKPPKGYMPNSEEKELASLYNLNNAQLYWRRVKIEELDGDISLFKQEYPATALEAFQTTGNPVFTQAMIDGQKPYLSKQPRYCIMVRTHEEVSVENVDRRFNCWQVAELPRAGDQYCIGIDTMEGRLSDVQDPKSNPDCDAAVVLNRNTGRFAAIYHGRGNQTDLGRQCLAASEFYNNAWTAPEIPQSMVLLNIYKEAGYQNLYNRQIHDQRINVEDSENLGWRTDLITRGWLVNDLIGCLRDDSIRIIFKDLLDEMQTFIKDKTGKPIHTPGKHDDILFAAMIAIQVHKRCPMDAAPYESDRTGEDIMPEKDESDNSLAMIGAVDNFEPEDDDYDEDYTY